MAGANAFLTSSVFGNSDNTFIAFIGQRSERSVTMPGRVHYLFVMYKHVFLTDDTDLMFVTLC